MARDWGTAGLSPGDEALCRYAEKLSSSRRRMGPEDIRALRTHGFDDAAIHDVTQVVGYFNYITRVADGLGVEPEDFIEPWGVSPR